MEENIRNIFNKYDVGVRNQFKVDFYKLPT